MEVVAITNQKGGVGKTTTAINLGAALAALGKRVVVMDLDPQGNASTGLGWTATARSVTTYDLLVGEAELTDVVQETAFPGLLLAPGTLDLSSVDVELAGLPDRLVRLRNAIRSASFDEPSPDYILMDCPPSLNMLTLNALVAAQSMVVPLQAEFFALEGLSQLMLTVREVRRDANPKLRIAGVVLTMYDRRNRLSSQVEMDVRETMGELVFDTVVPRNVRLGEAPSHAMPILAYDPQSQGSQAYCVLAEEFLRRHGTAATHAEAV